MNLPTVAVSQFHIVGSLKSMVLALGLLFGMASVAHCSTGCDPFGAQAPNAKEQRYTARIVGCAATAKTKAEDHACRVAVNKEFGLCEGTGPFAGQMPGDCE